MWVPATPDRPVMLRPLAAFLLLAPLAQADEAWDATPHDPAGEVTATDDLVVQRSADGAVEVFGSSGRTWHALAAAGATIEGQGARTLLVRDGAAFVAFSALRDASASLLVPAGASSEVVGVGADTALVVLEVNGARTAYAFSAGAGVWIGQPLAPGVLGDRVVGDGVCGLNLGPRYWGFSANAAQWVARDALFGGAELVASGDTLLVDQRTNGGPIATALAFSGVRGCWVESPALALGTGLAVDAAVACGVTGTAGSFAAVAYSAPRARWIASTRSYLAPPGVLTSRGVVAVTNAAGSVVEAFGAEHASWHEPAAPLPQTTFALGGDQLVACDPGDDTVVGFSALVPTGFVARTKPLGATADFPGGAHLGVLELDRGPWKEVRAFSPTLGVWSGPLVLTANAPVFVGDSVVHAVGSAALGYALDARECVWRGLGTTLPDGTVGSTVAVGGAVIAHQTSVGGVELFDGACAAWADTFDQGVVHTHTAAGNTVLATPNSAAGALRAFSARRGAWSTESSATLPVGQPVAAANVAAAVDAAGVLWAFSATNDARVLPAWPYDARAPVGGLHPFVQPGIALCYDDLVRVAVRGRAGEVAVVLVGPHAICPPETLPPIAGALWMPSASTQLLVLGGVFPSAGVEVVPLSLGGLTGSGVVRAQVQTLHVDLGTFAARFGDRRTEPITVH